jgi:hypothetical protein
MKSFWANRHSQEGPKNLLSALKDGAQSEGVQRPCSVSIELGWSLFGRPVCAGVRAKELPEETVHRRHGFWPLQRTPLSPPGLPVRLFQRGKMLEFFDFRHFSSL